MSIRIFYDYPGFRYKGWRKLEKILRRIIKEDGKVPGNLNIIISDDNKIREINSSFLEHDYYTDVITFNYNSENITSGEIYVSLDTVRVNSQNYDVSLMNELTRVIIHGVLHLSGFDDKTKNDKVKMRSAEDIWMERLEGEK